MHQAEPSQLTTPVKQLASERSSRLVSQTSSSILREQATKASDSLGAEIDHWIRSSDHKRSVGTLVK